MRPFENVRFHASANNEIKMKLYWAAPPGQARHSLKLVCLSARKLAMLLFLACLDFALAQTNGIFGTPSELKKLSLEQLMDLEVTSVSKRPEKLTEAPSAIQVITQEDIHRSGATSLPEALRLASNLA